MAVIKRYIASEYPSGLIATYNTLQDAVNAVPNPRTQSEIIEVEADNNTSETIIGFGYNTKSYSEHLLVIRGKEGQDISLSRPDANPMIEFVISSGVIDHGNILVENFTILGDSTGSRAIRVAGRDNSGTNILVKDITFKNLRGVFTNANRLEVSRYNNIIYEDCNFTVNTGNLIVGFGSSTVLTNGTLTLKNSIFKCNDTSNRLLSFTNVLTDKIHITNCSFDSAQLCMYIANPQELLIDRCLFNSNGNVIHVIGHNSLNSAKIKVTNSIIRTSEYVCAANTNIGEVEFYYNTIPWYGTAAHSAIFVSNINQFFKAKGNILSTLNSTGTALKNFIKLTWASTTNIENNYNLYYRHPGTNFRIFENTDSVGTTTSYSNLSDVNTISQELNSVEDDPMFTDPTYSGNTWYILMDESPAVDLIPEPQLDELDYRGYYRQDFYTDAGAWDHDADVLEKPVNDPLRAQFSRSGFIIKHGFHSKNNSTINGNLDVIGGFKTIGSSTFTGSVQGEVYPLNISANTASLDLNNGTFFSLQLISGSDVRIEPQNIKPGLTISLKINTTGSGTVTFPSSVKQPSGSLYVPTTGSGVDIITFISFDSYHLYSAYVKTLI